MRQKLLQNICLSKYRLRLLKILYYDYMARVHVETTGRRFSSNYHVENSVIF